jgi:glutathione reductase (NADPH)
MTYDYDLFIIGAGPAGLAAAKRAAQQDLKVAIAEQDHLGGCCVNRGCIPKKLMVYAADYASALKDATEYGWQQCSSQFQWQQFLNKRNHELQRLRKTHERSLQDPGVNIYRGHAQFVDDHTLIVNDQKRTAEKILIAVGGKAIKPEEPGFEYTVTSNELLNLEQLPERIAIIGGGYIGVEFASILQGLGCEVTIVNRENMILEGFDDDVRSAVQEGLAQRGVKILCNATTEEITKAAQGFCLQLTGDRTHQLSADIVLCAIGRTPNLEALELEKAGVEFDQKAIAVDQYGCTSQPHIYAVGDCTNRKQLTPVAKAEGQIAIDRMLGKPTDDLDYDFVPSAVLSRPEAASVGLTEAQAREQYGDVVECDRKEFVPLQFSLMAEPQQALIKLVVNRETDRILGLHMVGVGAEEVVQCGLVAIQKGVTRQDLLQTIAIHPSTVEELFS